MNHVLLVAPTPIVEQRAGPAIRYWEFARVLSRQQPVTLLTPNDDPPAHPDFAVRPGPAADLDSLLDSHQVVVVQGPALQRYPDLANALGAGQHYLIVDLYDPITLEQLEIDRGGEQGRWLHREYTALLNEQLRLGDFFLCATERQRDYWLGALSALGRVNPDTYDGARLRNLIDVVPFGLPAEPPPPAGPVLKGVVDGIAPDDQVILWGGGLWDWLDPLTPIRAMQEVGRLCPRARLVFFETARYETTMARRARQLAVELDLLGHTVIFAPWLPQERWGACLLEADVGLSFHRDTLETRLSFRTRILDYIWARLPIAAASGDELSQLVREHLLGYLVEPGDKEALVKALIALLGAAGDRRWRAGYFGSLAEGFSWEKVTRPLVAYCRQPWPAGDKGSLAGQRLAQAGKDRLLSDLAHAERQRAELQARVQILERERDEARRQAGRLSAQLDEAQAELAAALNGRLMRALTGGQRAWRRLWGRGS